MPTGITDFHKMTVTVLKSEFVKSDPLQIKYMDYKNYNHANFREELNYKLLANENSSTDFILCEVVEIHAPMKIKKARANNSPFMTKSLRKMIMNWSRRKNVYFKTKTVENWENYRKLRNACTKSTRKTKKEYFQNLDMNDITDNRTFWKTVKPWFTSKGIKGTKKIILVEKGEIISDNTKVTEVMNNYFVDITKELNISLPNFNNTDKSDLIFIDPIDQIINDYSKHPSILVINERIEHSTIFVYLKESMHP